MGFFSKKSPPPPPPKPPLPKPGPVGAGEIERAKAFMGQWVHIVGQASDRVFWDALARFGQIGGAEQAADNSQAANMRLFAAAERRFNNDFNAMFDWPWKSWR